MSVMTGADGSGSTTPIVRSKATDAWLTEPAAFVSVAVRSCAPLLKSTVGVRCQLPFESTTAEPIATPLSNTVTRSPATPPPPSIWRAVVDVPFGSIEPTFGANTEKMVGADGSGSTTPIVRSKTTDAWLTEPAAFVSIAMSAWAPLLKSTVGVRCQLPLASTTAEPIDTPLSKTVTISPLTQPPPSIGRALVDVPFGSIGPTFGSSTEKMVGADGSGSATATVRSKAADGALMVPAAFVSVAVRSCAPLLKSTVGVKCQLT